MQLGDDPERPSYRQTRLDIISKAKGRSATKKTTVERMVFQSKLNGLMEIPEMGLGQKKKISGLNPDIIKKNKEMITDKEKELNSRKKRRLFFDFLGCGGWR